MLLVGDIAPGDCQVDFSSLESKVILGNLEGPICPQNEKYALKKAGPHLRNSFNVKNNQSFIFSLANNHLMDYSDYGLSETLNFLRNEGYLYAGAGHDIISARLPVFFQKGTKKIALISCCERQFGIADWNSPGCAHEGSWVISLIKELKAQVDYVVVSSHRACEMSPFPSPQTVSLYRSYVDAGCDLVHGHHSHVPQSIEWYNGGFIAYGLGNFCVPYEAWKCVPNALWSLTLDVDFRDQLSVNLLPVELKSKKGQLLVVPHSNKVTALNHISKISAPLVKAESMHALWQEVSLQLYHEYANEYLFQDSQTLFAALKNFFRACMGKSSQRDVLLAYHVLACESHLEVVQTALRILTGVEKDVRSVFWNNFFVECQIGLKAS